MSLHILIQTCMVFFVCALYTVRPGPRGCASHKNSEHGFRIASTRPIRGVTGIHAANCVNCVNESVYCGEVCKRECVLCRTVVVLDFCGHHAEHEHALIIFLVCHEMMALLLTANLSRRLGGRFMMTAVYGLHERLPREKNPAESEHVETRSTNLRCSTRSISLSPRSDCV